MAYEKPGNPAADIQCADGHHTKPEYSHAKEFQQERKGQKIDEHGDHQANADGCRNNCFGNQNERCGSKATKKDKHG